MLDEQGKLRKQDFHFIGPSKSFKSATYKKLSSRSNWSTIASNEHPCRVWGTAAGMVIVADVLVVKKPGGASNERATR